MSRENSILRAHDAMSVLNLVLYSSRFHSRAQKAI
jgi:hypothetical protein